MRNNIGEARRAYGRHAGRLTQDDAAVLLNVAPSTYRKWEQGRTSVDGERLSEIADLYGVTVDYLLARGPSGPVGWPDATAAELLRRMSRLNAAGRARLLEAAAILEDSGRYALA